MDDLIKGIAQVTGYSERTVMLMAVRLGIDLETCSDDDLRLLVEELVLMGERIKAALHAPLPRIRCDGSLLPSVTYDRGDVN